MRTSSKDYDQALAKIPKGPWDAGSAGRSRIWHATGYIVSVASVYIALFRKLI